MASEEHTPNSSNNEGEPKAPTPVASLAASAALRRLERTTACLPIVHGSVAFYLGKKADEYNTHQWTLYLRGPNNEDLSPVLSKVVFQLHASFAQPVREIIQPPYEVTERGWGEFEAQIRLIWKDPSEKPTMLTHAIKLYPPGAPINVAPTDIETPVVSEVYDEVVFTDPTEVFYGQLQRVGTAPPIMYSQQAHFREFADTEQFQSLLEAQKFLQDELTKVRDRLHYVDTEMKEVDEEVQKVQESHQQRMAQQQRTALTAKKK